MITGRFFRLNFLFYSVGLLLLVGAYSLCLESGGFRLPYYYSPDGKILSISPTNEPAGIARIHEIDFLDVSTTPAVFPTADPKLVVTEIGTSIMPVVPNNRLRVILDFKFFIFFSFIFLLCGIWFLEPGKDLPLATYCFTVAALCFSTVMVVAYHSFLFFWQLCYFALIPALLNMGLRTVGKEIKGPLVLGELVTLLFLLLIAQVGRDSALTFLNLRLLNQGLLLTTLLFVTALQFNNAIKKTNDPIERRKRWVLFAGTLAGMLSTTLLIQYRYLMPVTGDFSWYIFALGLTFPASLLYGTYRVHLIPFQFVLTKSIQLGLLTLFLIMLYVGVLLVHGVLLPEQEQENRWIVHLIFVLSLVLFLDPMRRQLATFLERRILRLDAEQTASLQRIALQLAAPMKVQATANSFFTEIRDTLRTRKVSLLLSTPHAFDLRQGNLIRISEKSLFWKHIKPEKTIVTSYLTYGGGSRGELYRFLLRHDYFLAVGVVDTDIRAALLIGTPPGGRKFKLTEIRYIQEVARLAGMLIQNYFLLQQEIEKRRKVRELSLAGQLQRNISSPFQESISDVKLALFNRPCISVTGDYLDIIPLSKNRIAFFLGDVSGHGLGTGYLESAVRSIVRAHLEDHATLGETFEAVNAFLLERYRGNDFITLFGLILCTDSGRVEYVNAAHPGPYLKTPHLSELVHFKNTQTLVGFLPASYRSEEMQLNPGQRLFLYSDGIPETFNNREEAFGDELLSKFLSSHGDEPLTVIRDSLQQTLEIFRDGGPQTDDMTFLALEYAPGHKQPLRDLFPRAETETPVQHV